VNRVFTFIGRQVTVLNLLLAATLAFFVWLVIVPMWLVGSSSDLPKMKASTESEGSTLANVSTTNGADVARIIQENVFHPERRFPIPPKKVEKIEAKPQFVLYGTFINHEKSIAFIEDKASPLKVPEGGHKQITLKVGDVISGYRVSRIEQAKVMLVKDKDTMVLTLDGKKGRSEGMMSPGPLNPISSPVSISPPQSPPSQYRPLTSPGAPGNQNSERAVTPKIPPPPPPPVSPGK
jgi:type II secretory pathway component PulC